MDKLILLVDQQLDSGETSEASGSADGDSDCPDDEDQTGTEQADDPSDGNTGAENEASEAVSNDEPAEPEPKDYVSDQGDEIQLPLGAKSFATSVVDFEVGDPAPDDEYMDPLEALGEPNYTGSMEGFVSLGGHGSITLEFEDAYLVNGIGDDLYIFEVGPSVEAMDIEISTNGEDWLFLGQVSGGTSSIDIEPHLVSEDDQFSFIRITDLKDDTFGDTPGADIDAVAIINGVLK